MENLKDIVDNLNGMTLRELQNNLETGKDNLTVSDVERIIKDLNKVRFQLMTVKNVIKMYELIDLGEKPQWKQINK